jgi:hypothetical protein
VGPGLGLAVAVALLAALAFGAHALRTNSFNETSLLHELGQPVDVVEQFVAALNYGQLDVAAGSIAAGAARVELPFQSSPPDQIAATLAIFRDSGAAIQMFGCEPRSSAGNSTFVACSVSFVNDFVREQEAEYLRGTMEFVVEDERIQRVSSDLVLTGEERFEAWLLDFYTSQLPRRPGEER